jgi:DNA-binding transcriptional regulator YiaG
MDKTTRLRALRDQHSLTSRNIAGLLGVEEQTVRRWCAVHVPVEIPDTKLQLLELLLKE